MTQMGFPDESKPVLCVRVFDFVHNPPGSSFSEILKIHRSVHPGSNPDSPIVVVLFDVFVVNKVQMFG
jgi:hypothetical protein